MENHPDAKFSTFFQRKYAERFFKMGAINFIVYQTIGKIPILKYTSAFFSRTFMMSTLVFDHESGYCDETPDEKGRYLCPFSNILFINTPINSNGEGLSIILSQILSISLFNSQFLMNFIFKKKTSNVTNSILSSILTSLYFTYLSKDSSEKIFKIAMSDPQLIAYFRP